MPSGNSVMGGGWKSKPRGQLFSVFFYFPPAILSTSNKMLHNAMVSLLGWVRMCSGLGTKWAQTSASKWFLSGCHPHHPKHFGCWRMVLCMWSDSANTSTVCFYPGCLPKPKWSVRDILFSSLNLNTWCHSHNKHSWIILPSFGIIVECLHLVVSCFPLHYLHYSFKVCSSDRSP